MLMAVRAESTTRLAEVLQLLEQIRDREAIPPIPDPPDAKILRGLFFVHLYSALEFTVNKAVEAFLTEAQVMSIAPEHMHPRFYSVALDSNFASLRNIGEDKRWVKRVELIDLLGVSSPQKIDSQLFGLYLQNVWIRKIEVMFSCLAISQPPVPDPSYRLYVDELVERRNAVAHGRESALQVGSGRRSPDLLIRYTAISATCAHVLDCIEGQHANKGIVLQPYRARYV